MSVPEPHKDYQGTHRMPRLLIVANNLRTTSNGMDIDWNTRLLANETGCSCMKFCASGPNNVHVLIPAKYEGGALTAIEKVCAQAAAEQRPYDVVIVDSEACGKEVIRLAERIESKPAVVLYASDAASAEKIRDAQIPAFYAQEMIVDRNTGLCGYDVQLERALGEEGVKRLECQDNAPSSAQQWRTEGVGYKQVEPKDAVRSVVKFFGERSAGGG